MNKFALTVSAVCLCFQMASASPDVAEDIKDLAGQIRMAVQSSNASESQLQEVRSRLVDVLNVLNNGSTNPPIGNGDCLKFAYEKYYQSHSSSVATDMAAEACRKIADVSVAKFLYEKYYQAQSSSTAMSNAADHSGFAVSGKLDMIQFAYEKFYQAQSAVTAANNAVQVISPVPRGSLSCIQTAFAGYYQQNSAPVAMTKAAQACQ